MNATIVLVIFFISLFIVIGVGLYVVRKSQHAQSGGGKLTKYMSFKNPYGIIVFLVIAFAIWNFYAKKNKAEQEE
jgi:fucose permease